MKKISVLLLAICFFMNVNIKAQEVQDVVLSPYIFANPNTPNANKALEDKLKRIVTKYGLYSENGSMLTPFILTAHSLESRQETTATVPPHTAVELSLTFYVGNGEDGTLFASCNMELKGVGNNLDQAYASAYKKINVNDPELEYTIKLGKEKIVKYYKETAPGLIKRAEGLAASGDFDGAYALLLQIPAVCPQYNEAQSLLVKYVQKESDSKNSDIVRRARAAWSASPEESGAAEASSKLQEMNNVSPSLQAEASALMKEMSTRQQKAHDKELEAEMQRDAQAHAENMAAIKGATKVAVAQASRPVYRVWWW